MTARGSSEDPARRGRRACWGSPSTPASCLRPRRAARPARLDGPDPGRRRAAVARRRAGATPIRPRRRLPPARRRLRGPARDAGRRGSPRRLAAIPPGDRELVTSHDALGYFADRYGFEVVATAFPATGPEAEASAGSLRGHRRGRARRRPGRVRARRTTPRRCERSPRGRGGVDRRPAIESPARPAPTRDAAADAELIAAALPRIARAAGADAGAVVAAIAIATVVAIVVLWPGERRRSSAEGLTAPTERAEITEVTRRRAPRPSRAPAASARPDRDRARRRESSPPFATVGSRQTSRSATRSGHAGGRATGAAGPARPSAAPQYNLTDFERRRADALAGAAFAALVIVFGRLRGALSLLGLAASLLVVILVHRPGDPRRRPPLAVALVGSLAVMLLTISLAHGLGAKSLAAILGTRQPDARRAARAPVHRPRAPDRARRGGGDPAAARAARTSRSRACCWRGW